MRTQAPTGRRPVSTLLPCVALLGVLLACGTPSDPTPDGPEPEPQPTPAATSEAVPTPAARAPRVGAPTPQPPVAITLPDGSEVPVRVASTLRNGVLGVPDDIREAGWWQGGSRLGDPFGSTLIAAHVDSAKQGLGPFASLLQVRPGDRVRLRSSHLGQAFEITSLELIPRAAFAERPGLRSPQGPRRLVLVTCAPPFDAARGSYTNLAVLVATPVAGPTDRRTP